MVARRGVVKWFDAKKGYGFIVHPDGGADIFVHFSQIISERRFKTLRTGQWVEFELHEGPKGLDARNVVPLDEVTARREASGSPTNHRGGIRPHAVGRS